MKISELISKLEEIKKNEGDLNICVSEPHEYFGSIEKLLTEYDIRISENLQPYGTKGNIEKGIIISYS